LGGVRDPLARSLIRELARGTRFPAAMGAAWNLLF
jgi:hypothetical protein